MRLLTIVGAMQNKRVYILIVTYNASNWLSTCCRVAAQLPPNWQTLVVDNASTDGTVELLKREYPHVRLVESKKNLGFGRANNIGLAIALEEGADFVFLLNQDAETTTEDLHRLIAVQQENPEYIVLSPMQLDGTGTRLDTAFSEKCVPANLKPFFAQSLYHEVPLYHCDEGIAAGWMLSRIALEQIGGFSPLFFHYGEDEDYVNRVHYHGYRVGVAPLASIRHHREQRPKKKPVDSRFTDSLIAMANPANPPQHPLAVVKAFIRPLRKLLLKRQTSLALFLMQSCRNLMRGNAEGTYREIASRKGPAFIRHD